MRVCAHAHEPGIVTGAVALCCLDQRTSITWAVSLANAFRVHSCTRTGGQLGELPVPRAGCTCAAVGCVRHPQLPRGHGRRVLRRTACMCEPRACACASPGYVHMCEPRACACASPGYVHVRAQGMCMCKPRVCACASPGYVHVCEPRVCAYVRAQGMDSVWLPATQPQQFLLRSSSHHLSPMAGRGRAPPPEWGLHEARTGCCCAYGWHWLWLVAAAATAAVPASVHIYAYFGCPSWESLGAPH